MNQSGPGAILQLSGHVPVEGHNLHELPGADMIVSRDLTSGLYMSQIFNSSMTFDLDVAKDGRTAIVTISLDCDLDGGNGERHADLSFGKARIQERITVDLAAETPRVASVAFSQKLL